MPATALRSSRPRPIRRCRPTLTRRRNATRRRADTARRSPVGRISPGTRRRTRVSSSNNSGRRRPGRRPVVAVRKPEDPRRATDGSDSALTETLLASGTCQRAGSRAKRTGRLTPAARQFFFARAARVRLFSFPSSASLFVRRCAAAEAEASGECGPKQSLQPRAAGRLRLG